MDISVDPSVGDRRKDTCPLQSWFGFLSVRSGSPQRLPVSATLPLSVRGRTGTGLGAGTKSLLVATATCTLPVQTRVPLVCLAAPSAETTPPREAVSARCILVEFLNLP